MLLKRHKTFYCGVALQRLLTCQSKFTIFNGVSVERLMYFTASVCNISRLFSILAYIALAFSSAT